MNNQPLNVFGRVASRTRSRALIALAVLILLAALGVSGLVVSTWLYVHALPEVSDPLTYTRDFVPTADQAIVLPTGTGLSLMGDVVSYFQSPLFPYQGLDRVKVFSTYRCPISDRSLYLDRLWQVYWVRVTWCEQLARPDQLFGPMRSQ